MAPLPPTPFVPPALRGGCVRVHVDVHGHALVMALLLLVVIGLTSAAAMRSATSSERSVNNVRLENLAQQHAEMALRYCESEMYKAAADRVPALQSVDRAMPPLPDEGDWKKPSTWVGGAPASLAVPAHWWARAGAAPSTPAAATAPVSTASPASPASVASAPVPQLPRCHVEQVSLPGSGQNAYLVTARGYSPDFEQDPSTARTLRGGSVWLQSLLLTE